MKPLEPKSMINNNDQVGSTSEDAMCGRMNVEGDDRLSRLSNDLIYKILSFVSIKDAIGTSFLSSRWRFIWTSIPYLNLSLENYSPRYGFSDFVHRVLSRLNNQIQVSSVKLIHREKVSPDIVQKTVKYAVSHNVQQLTVTCFLGGTDFPLSFFSSNSLKHLTFGGVHYTSTCPVSPTWELPALTTLHLDLITLSDEHHTTTDRCISLFSKCTNLKNLSLRRCKIKGTNVFNIFHPSLSNLTLEETLWDMEVVNVVTPQLKNLTISYCYGKHMISAPGLTSLVLKARDPLQLSVEGLPFLEKVDLFIHMATLKVDHKIVCLLRQFHAVKFLTLTLNLLKLLCSSTELISHQTCAFPNLKISKFLTIHRGMVYMEAQEKVIVTSELKSQNTSPSAMFPMVSCEEIEVMRKLEFAQQLIEKLRVLLKLCEGNSDHITGCMRKRGNVQQVKTQWVQSAFEMQWHFGEMMEQIEQGKVNGLLTKELPTFETDNMISMLQCIEGLVTELPESKRPTLQVTFSSICAEAAILINYMIHGMQKPVIPLSSCSRKPKLN